MSADEAKKSKPLDIQEAIKSIIATFFEPANMYQTDGVELLTTDQIKDRINDFAGFGLENIQIYTAMIDAGFHIANTGKKLYWRCSKI